MFIFIIKVTIHEKLQRSVNGQNTPSNIKWLISDNFSELSLIASLKQLCLLNDFSLVTINSVTNANSHIFWTIVIVWWRLKFCHYNNNQESHTLIYIHTIFIIHQKLFYTNIHLTSSNSYYNLIYKKKFGRR